MSVPVVVGVFCNSTALLATLRDKPLARTTLRRAAGAGYAPYALVPWGSALDALAAELKPLASVRRTHPDERIAMRDLVARLGAEIGVVVNGACANIDADEIALAVARARHGIGEHGWYVSPRVRAMKAEDWLRVSDSDEWPAPTTTAAEALKFYGTHDIEKVNAREVWAEMRGRKHG